MPTSYNIQLKGYVGGGDFDRRTVDSMLASQSGKRVNVLIDSLGGSLATGLSISAAFKNHGDVAVHFVGLNASAATIASLGAAHISMDAGAMYLAHKCSMAFFEWGSLNSDQFGQLIQDIEKIRADLDKLDLNVAQLYARKCRKPAAELLALMKTGGWLTAKEALEWGFVDEITDLADEPAPKLTDALASAMASEGMPIPDIPLAEAEGESAFGRFLSAIASLFNSKSNSNMPTPEPTPSTAPQAPVKAQEQPDFEARIAQLEAKLADLEAENAALKKAPGDSSQQVIDDTAHAGAADKPLNDVERLVRTHNAVAELCKQL